MSYIPPDYDDTSELSMGVPAKGWQDSSIVAAVAGESKSGNPMITFSFVIDNGESLGYELKDYAPMGLESGFGEKKCKSIAVGAQWRWPTDLKSLDAFAKAFVQDPPLRVGLLIEHDLSMEVSPDSWKNGVSQEEWDAFEGRKNKKGQIAKYGKVRNEPEWTPAQSDDGRGFDPDDEVPF